LADLGRHRSGRELTYEEGEEDDLLPHSGRHREDGSHQARNRLSTSYSGLTLHRSHPQSHPHYSIRLFCTSSEHFRPPNAPYQAATVHITNRNIPIEHPSNPEAHVDEYSIPFKERGLRGKAGSAPPLDLNTSTKGIMLSTGRMTSVSMGHIGPSVGKKKEQAKVRTISGWS